MGKEKVLLLDGNSLAYRAFFALPLLSNATNVSTIFMLSVTHTDEATWMDHSLCSQTDPEAADRLSDTDLQ